MLNTKKKNPVKIYYNRVIVQNKQVSDDVENVPDSEFRKCRGRRWQRLRRC